MKATALDLLNQIVGGILELTGFHLAVADDLEIDVHAARSRVHVADVVLGSHQFARELFTHQQQKAGFIVADDGSVIPGDPKMNVHP